MIKCKAKKSEILLSMALNGYNQKILSDIAKVNKTTISLLLNNKITLTPKSAQKIANALSVEMNEIFEFVNLGGES
ncbi:helix-turn-helix domain-containing protein [Solibacillus sp. FSL R7-0682]|uniref:helix-turn-helix domain-containing protein n=1 Tax=Solibacillus sp. FSL R7-0682 TaxID=2921690 RepID=UPI0030F54A10